MICKITIRMDNAAFGNRSDEAGTELARILRVLAERVDRWCLTGSDNIPAWDLDGNRVGQLVIEED